MGTCTKCREELSGAELLECSDCEKDYCRRHLHNHDCEPVGDSYKEEEENSGGENVVKHPQGWGGGNWFPRLGYALSALAGSLGTLYLLTGLSAITGGGGLQELVSLVVAGSLFSAGTFLMVGSYIRSH